MDALKRKSGKRFTTYHRNVIFFDYISSVSYVLATVVAPVDSGIYQAKGNDATCTAQGVIQLGLTSMFYMSTFVDCSGYSTVAENDLEEVIFLVVYILAMTSVWRVICAPSDVVA